MMSLYYNTLVRYCAYRKISECEKGAKLRFAPESFSSRLTPGGLFADNVTVSQTVTDTITPFAGNATVS